MELPEATSMLARTPKVLDTLLAGLPAKWLHRDDGPGTWSAYDIVGHLLEGEATNWLPRTRMILQQGTGQAFEPFDREAMRGRGRQPAAVLLARFTAARLASLGPARPAEAVGVEAGTRGIPALRAVEDVNPSTSRRRGPRG